MTITVYGYNPWNAMVTVTPGAATGATIRLSKDCSFALSTRCGTKSRSRSRRSEASVRTTPETRNNSRNSPGGWVRELRAGCLVYASLLTSYSQLFDEWGLVGAFRCNWGLDDFRRCDG